MNLFNKEKKESKSLFEGIESKFKTATEKYEYVDRAKGSDYGKSPFTKKGVKSFTQMPFSNALLGNKK